MNITHWPQQERPRERLINLGAEALSDTELLAILLGKGTKGKNACELARLLLTHYQNLRDLFSASLASFQQIPGLGIAKYSQLQAAFELSRRHLQETLQRNTTITQTQDAEAFLIASLRHYKHEVFACLFLDNRHRVIQFEKLFHGTIDTTAVHPREVIKRALHHNAAAMIIAHNHPSGHAEPSQADKAITVRLKKALELIEVRLLDHIIVGDSGAVSFTEIGLI